ncbi:electron transfer flavoprotein regulatory factor 1-like [Littorina saxatilis]|uniref:Complex 1 LYR protein domain-containing protein n=1 Tax=Littorina saxatilis TaxID=31220 RepID=A0AAN9B2S7_9CAEN
MSAQNLHSKVIHLYKTLLYLGREYPKGYDYFRTKLKNAFMKNREVTDPKEIEMLISRGEYIVKELEALYMLRKYRTLKKRYYSDET